MRHFASLNDIDLTKSFAYADSHSDQPMLAAVGHPVAVSPDVPLMRVARANQWATAEWRIKPQTFRWTMPK